MGQFQEILPAKLIVSIFTQKDNLFLGIEEMLVNKFGPIDFKSQVMDFFHTKYYAEEFGSNLKRIFVSFKELLNPQDLWKAKIITNKLEEKFAKNNKRQFNLDPGLITQSNLVLASTKNFSHRIYIRDGIHQEITLIFKNKAFRPLPWTYPDYQSKECLDIFIKIRGVLNSQLKTTNKTSNS
ncbi:MAG: DUF4416 family protein [Candidatus Omnitrophota bacterium]